MRALLPSGVQCRRGIIELKTGGFNDCMQQNTAANCAARRGIGVTQPHASAFMKVLLPISVVACACAAPPSTLAPVPCPPGGIARATLLPGADQPQVIKLFLPPLP